MEVILLHAENPNHYKHLITKLKAFLDAKLFTNFILTLEKTDNFEYSLHYLIFAAFYNINFDYPQIYKQSGKFNNYHLRLNQTPAIISPIIELIYLGVTQLQLAQAGYLQKVAHQLNLPLTENFRNDEIINIEVPNHKNLLLDYLWNARINNNSCDLQFITKEFKKNFAHTEIFAIYSKQFEKIYKTRFEKSKPLILVLQNVENDHLEKLIEFCYKGIITFTQENIENLNMVSNKLGMPLILERTNSNCNSTNVLNNNIKDDMICIERPPSKPKPAVVNLINSKKNCGNCYIWHEQKCIIVHAIVMKTYCPFFTKVYDCPDWAERDVAVIINTFSYMEVKAIIDFIYTGEANLIVDELGIGQELLHWLGLPLNVIPQLKENHQNIVMDFETIGIGKTLKSERLSEEKNNDLNPTHLSLTQCNKVKRGNELMKPSDFICSECDTDFKNERSLKIHMKSHYPMIYQCKFCEKVFLKRCNLKRHETLHRAPEHQCETCGKCFGSKDYLIEHKRTHTGDKPYFCPICFKRFTGKTGLNHHTKVHDKKRSVLFVCDICGKKFTRQGLWGHMKTHNKEYSCDICEDKSFATPSALKRHIKWVHEKHPPLKCNFCQEEFDLKSLLDRHMVNVHYYYNGEFIRRKEYACDKCSQSFHTSARLQKHMMNRHSAKYLLPCNICGKLLSGSSAIKYHMRSHTGERPHSCSFCTKSFTRPDLLKKHMRIHTGERFICPVCCKSFTSKHYLTEHSWTHNISIDPEQCKSEARLPEDVTLMTTDTSECTKSQHCGQYVKSEEHLNNHQRDCNHSIKFEHFFETPLQLMDDIMSKGNSSSNEVNFLSDVSLKENRSSCFIISASYVCANCEIIFDTREELNSHNLYCQPIF